MKPETWWKISLALLLVIFAILSLALIYEGLAFFASSLTMYTVILVIPFWILSLATIVQFYKKKKSGFYLALIFASILALIVVFWLILIPIMQSMVMFYG